ncbi:MAG TPA: phosphoadenylyl-sulfate reductase [Bacillus bacterium]|nr:phosphoadenylyl-sulfate reductase [Bacillus sp. (in: firmicutes)]
MNNNLLNYENFNSEKGVEFQVDNDTKGAIEVLTWAYSHYGEEIVYACSFGVEGMVLIDLISKVKPNAKIVFLDTDLHFEETYQLIDKVRIRYPELRIEIKKTSLTLEEQAKQYGPNLWGNNANKCCELRKIIPLQEVLSSAMAWLSGLRRDQSESRINTEFINQDHKFKSIKVCPLIHWTWKDIWRYVHKNGLPYNELHDKAYPSIGCKTCTQPTFNIDDLRSGRWTGTGKVECGLHQS